MILSKEIAIKIGNNNYKKYEKIGYKCVIGEFTMVNINDIKPTDHYFIHASCDLCNKEATLQYFTYTKSFNQHGLNLYTCKKCSYFKKKITVNFKYGVDNVSQLIKVKQLKQKLSFEKYGTNYVFQSEEIKDKIKKTCLIKYGVDNPTKNPEIFLKAQKNSFKKFKYLDTELIYQSSYELDFINHCIINNVLLENGPNIKYSHNGIDRTYFSDFYIRELNLIIEIKSMWTFNCDSDEHLSKMNFSMKQGYDFLFIIDKDYIEFDKRTNSLRN